jgi:hypothetical protein
MFVFIYIIYYINKLPKFASRWRAPFNHRPRLLPIVEFWKDERLRWRQMQGKIWILQFIAYSPLSSTLRATKV